MKILSELDKKDLMQIKIMDLYNNGHTYKEIALLTKKTESSVKKIVNTWINKMPLNSQNLIRKNHKINTLDKKKLNKVLKYELKKIMGDKDFVSKNPSIYKTSITGDITLKSQKEIGCSTTWDTPRKLKIKN
ncbi:DNA-binding response regulator [Clostridium perfringens]|uniref:DNA-binding response regulator n=1 Tax=Clostridium perfringens TaxID=1502 RepID=UPI001ABB3499|nr:DNA-binding response regulator [Clostridium perfringens]MBO3323627.1 DNA-binding response regulator [Clostridium perfringens]MBO3332892.1 DNA-binding response regulator [Clostridium perfringens]